MTSANDVLIVGAGPVGLALGVALRTFGIDCRIVDRRGGPTPLEESRALALWPRTIEVFDRFSVADAAITRGKRMRAVNIRHGDRGLARIEIEFGPGVETKFPFMLILPQGETERILIDRFQALGGTIERDSELIGLEPSGEMAIAQIRRGDGREDRLQGHWLVGCDGARSAVRHHLGLAFAGAAYEESFLLIDAHVGWSVADDEAWMFYLPEGGAFAAFPLPEKGRWRMVDISGVVTDPEPGAERIRERFLELIRSVGHAGATIDDVRWTSAFRVQRRLVDRERIDRVFVVGDAAHIHSPAGGQGMNTGIQDAFNLAWKLAAVIQGQAKESLLDSYSAERRPIAEAILRGTDMATRMVTMKVRSLMALRDVAVYAVGHVGPLRRRLARTLSELELSYRGSPIVAEDGHGLHAPHAGDRLPDVSWLADDGATRYLTDELARDRATLLIFAGDGESGPTIDPFGTIMEAVGPFAGAVEPVAVLPPGWTGPPAACREIADEAGALHERFGADRPVLVLVRPDGHIGYRSRPAEATHLREYLDRVYTPTLAS